MITKIFFLLGLFLIVAASIVGFTTAKWSLLSLGLLLVGFISIGFGIIKSTTKFWHKRSTEVGTNILISTIAILIVIGSLNFLAIRHSTRFDLTETKIFTLSPQSQTIAKNLTKPLKVLVFDRNTNPEIKTLLNNYSRYGKNFQYDIVDPEIEIGLAKEFGVQSVGEVYLQYGDKKQRVSNSDLALGETLSETQLTSAIEKIQQDRSIVVYLLQGHGESSLEPGKGSFSQAAKNLQDRGYTVKPLNLASSSEIPQDTNLIVISGATRSLFPAEVKALQTYLDRGGNLLLALTPTTDPGLTPLLQNWGIELDDRLIIDTSGAGNILGLGPAAPIIDAYGNHPITKSFGNGISVFPESRPLKIVKRSGIEATPLVTTKENTWAEKDLSQEKIVFDAKKDIAGPLNIAIALSRPINNQISRMVVFGSATFLTDGWLQQQLNGDLFLNSVNWLLGEGETTLSIRPKDQTNRRLNLTPLQAGIISWMALRIMPLFGLVMAGIIWWRRR
jgi:ABC-type uncharacterized transport system involved in gliding motility auxiliary subunit